MIQYFLFLLLISIWTIGYYYHFVMSEKSPIMVAFVGQGHALDFQRTYQHVGDLWIFKSSRKRSLHLRVGRTPFRTFKKESYTNMLLVKEPIQIPLIKDSTRVVEYVFRNRTIASLWPRLRKWPPESEKDPLQWYRDLGGKVYSVSL